MKYITILAALILSACTPQANIKLGALVTPIEELTSLEPNPWHNPEPTFFNNN